MRRDHSQTLDAAVRGARTAKTSLEDSHKEVDGGLAAAEVGSRHFAPGEKLSISERQRLFRRGRCFYCRKVGHIAAYCPQKDRAGGRRAGKVNAPGQSVNALSSDIGRNELVVIGVLQSPADEKKELEEFITHC